MSAEQNREIIEQTAARYAVPAFIPLSIARTESDLYERCVGDDGTSFGLFQLHRGGLAPEELTDEELFDPAKNAQIAISHMQRAYITGSQEGLSGIELVKFVAFTSGWPGMLGVAWTEENRPDYVQRLAKMYLLEVDGEQPSKEPEPPSPPAGGGAGGGGIFTAYESWYISPGDTLSSIAAHVRVPVSVLAKFNRIDNPDVIQAGETLLVPRAIRVKAGDTLGSLCEQYGAGDYHFIADVNAHANPDLISTGEILYM